MIRYKFQGSDVSFVINLPNAEPLSQTALNAVLQREGLEPSLLTILAQGQKLTFPVVTGPKPLVLTLRPTEEYESLNATLLQYEKLKEFYETTNTWDIVILYAVPLALKRRHQLVDYETELDFQQEFEAFADIFKHFPTPPRVKMAPATLSQLAMTFGQKAKLVHISCHGGFDSGSDEYFLELESSTHVGLLDRVTSKRLEAALTQQKQHFNVAVLSACFSAKISEAFEHCGFTHVISVHERWKIHDKTAIAFSIALYRALSRTSSLRTAFYTAREAIRCDSSLPRVCCCRHTHTSECKLMWNYQCRVCGDCDVLACECGSLTHEHSPECSYLQSFQQFCPEARLQPSDDKVKCCCCSPELTHSDAEKFLVRPELDNHSVLKFNRSPLKEEPRFNLGEAAPRSYSRGAFTTDLLEQMQQHPCIFLHGRKGIGKSTVVKYAAQYAYHRMVPSDGVLYFNLQGVRTAADIAKQCPPLNGSVPQSIGELMVHLEERNVLLIFDHVQRFADRSWDSFKDKLLRLLARCKFCKIWVVSEDRLHFGPAHQIEIPELNEGLLCSYLNYKLGYVLSKQQKDAYKELIRNYQLTFTQVNCLLQHLQAGNTLEEFRQKISDTGVLKVTRRLRSLCEGRAPMRKFLGMLALFPDGVCQEYLDMLCQAENIDLSQCLQELAGTAAILFARDPQETREVKLTKLARHVMLEQVKLQDTYQQALTMAADLAWVCVDQFLGHSQYANCPAAKSLSLLNPRISSIQLPSAMQTTLHSYELSAENPEDVFQKVKAISVSLFKTNLRKVFGHMLDCDLQQVLLQIARVSVSLKAIRQNERALDFLKVVKSALSLTEDSQADMLEVFCWTRLITASLKYQFKQNATKPLCDIEKVIEDCADDNLSELRFEAYFLSILISFNQARDVKHLKALIRRAREVARELAGSFVTGLPNAEMAEARICVLEAWFYRDFSYAQFPDSLISQLKQGLDCFQKFNVSVYEVMCLELIADLSVRSCSESSLREAELFWGKALTQARMLGDLTKVQALQAKRDSRRTTDKASL